MTTAVQHRRGTTAEHSTFTGLEGEVTIDTTKDTAVIHDGVLAGGYPLAKETLANVNPSSLTAITGAATASDDLFMVYDASTTSMKKITRAELNNAMEADALANVSITGGTINGTTIGGTTAAAGSFTTLSASGAVTVGGNTTLGDASTDTVTVNGYMGVGGSPLSAVGVYLQNSALTGASQRGFYSSVTGNSSATTAVDAFLADPRTAAASFTTNRVSGFLAADATKGAGSTITNQHGVYIADQTQGTNNYGITSLVSSGTNKWNIYASGTAANYFAGNVGIGTSSPSSFNQVVNAPHLVVGSGANTPGVTLYSATNASGSISFADGTTTTEQYRGLLQYAHTDDSMRFYTASTERMRIDSSGNVGIGTSSPAYPLAVSGAGSVQVQIRAGNTSDSVLLFGDTDSAAIGRITYAHASDSMVFTTNSVIRATIDSSGNLGLGVTPSAWSAGRAIEVGFLGNSLYGNSSNNMNVVAGAYFNSGFKYAVSSVPVSYYNQSNGAHAWLTAPSGTAGNAISFTQALSVGHGTSLALQGATSQTGTGITFPATQNASSDANTLDDYEEGTFTPTIAGTTSTGIGIYVTQIGKYTKVGNRVMFAIELVWTAHTGTGNMEIRGLPFTAGSMNIAAAIRPDNMTLSAGYYPISFIYSGSTIIQLAQTPTGTVNAALIPMDTSANVMVTSHYDIA